MRRPLALACLLALLSPAASAGVSFGTPLYPAPGSPQVACVLAHTAPDAATCNVAGPVNHARVVTVSAEGMLNVHVFVLDEDRGRTLASFDCAGPSCQRAFPAPVTARAVRLLVVAEALAPGAGAVVSVSG